MSISLKTPTMWPGWPAGTDQLCRTEGHGTRRYRKPDPFRHYLFRFRRHRTDGIAHRFYRRPGLRTVDRPRIMPKSCGTACSRPANCAASSPWAATRWNCCASKPGLSWRCRFPAGAWKPFAPPTRARPSNWGWAGWFLSTKAFSTAARPCWKKKKKGSRYHLVKLDIDGNKPASDSFVYAKGKKYAGTVTSAMWSPSAKASIALASLEAPYGKPGEEFEVEIYYQRELKWSRDGALHAWSRTYSGIRHAGARRHRRISRPLWSGQT